jgi:ATP-dependent Clp protease ATP-binding subunit ClpC
VGPQSASEPKILVTVEARRCVQLARDEARALGQPLVGTEHLLLAILRCERSHAVRALHALGVSHDRAIASLQPTMTGRRRAAAESPHKDGVSPQARRVLENSLREALKRGDGYIGVEHLLLALMSDSRNGAMQTLELLRVTPARIRRQLDQEWLAALPSA